MRSGLERRDREKSLRQEAGELVGGGAQTLPLTHPAVRDASWGLKNQLFPVIAEPLQSLWAPNASPSTSPRPPSPVPFPELFVDLT